MMQMETASQLRSSHPIPSRIFAVVSRPIPRSYLSSKRSHQTDGRSRASRNSMLSRIKSSNHQPPTVTTRSPSDDELDTHTPIQSLLEPVNVIPDRSDVDRDVDHNSGSMAHSRFNPAASVLGTARVGGFQSIDGHERDRSSGRSDSLESVEWPLCSLSTDVFETPETSDSSDRSDSPSGPSGPSSPNSPSIPSSPSSPSGPSSPSSPSSLGSPSSPSSLDSPESSDSFDESDGHDSAGSSSGNNGSVGIAGTSCSMTGHAGPQSPTGGHQRVLMAIS